MLRSGEGYGGWGWVLTGAAILGASLLDLGCGALADKGEPAVVEFVEDQGYTDVTVVDRDYFMVGLRGCGEDDAFGYDIHATSSATGREVDLDVCGALWKGMTLRK